MMSHELSIVLILNILRHVYARCKNLLAMCLAYLSEKNIRTSVLKHDMFVEIRHFFKLEMKQNISTVILVIKVLVISNEIRSICMEFKYVYIIKWVLKHFCVYQSFRLFFFILMMMSQRFTDEKVFYPGCTYQSRINH